MVEDGRRVKTI